MKYKQTLRLLMLDFSIYNLSKNRIPILRELPKCIIQYLVTAWENKYIFTFPIKLDVVRNN